MAKRKPVEAVEAPAVAVAEVAPDVSVADAPQQKKYAPDPYEFGRDRATGLKLFQSHRLYQVAIKYDQPICAEGIEILNKAGWTERADESVWTKQWHNPKKPDDGHLPRNEVVYRATGVYAALVKAQKAELGIGQER